MGQDPSAESNHRSGREKYPALFEIRMFAVLKRPHQRPITRTRRIQFTHTHTSYFLNIHLSLIHRCLTISSTVPPVTLLSVSFIFPIHATCPTKSQSLIRVNLLTHVETNELWKQPTLYITVCSLLLTATDVSLLSLDFISHTKWLAVPLVAHSLTPVTTPH